MREKSRYLRMGSAPLLASEGPKGRPLLGVLNARFDFIVEALRPDDGIYRVLPAAVRDRFGGG